MNYITYSEITKDVLNLLQMGDLVKINDWTKPMRVKGISENYVAMTCKQFGDTYYSIIEMKPWSGIKHNEMTGGCCHCSTDDWIFGAPDFDYNFEDSEAVKKYLDDFEKGKVHLSERRDIPINAIQIKHK